MTMRELHKTRAKYISFANGFPRKEMVPSNEQSSRIRGGFFVGLHDGATSCMTKTQKIVPPLAKKRVNSDAFKPRASSSRYRTKKDPFSVHKGTEQIGFSPQTIKQRRPRAERANQKLEEKNLDRKLKPTRFSRPTEIGRTMESENGALPNSIESCNKDVILSDVEKQRALSELIGIDEVYQNVCKGNMNSLSTLVGPARSKSKRAKDDNRKTLKYIHNSSPLTLKQKQSAKGPSIIGLNPLSKSRNSVLVPLPFFPKPRSSNTAPARLKESYAYPKVYSSRLEKPRFGVASSLSGWSSPSIINFNPVVDLPDYTKRPVSRVQPPTGSIIGVPNKAHTGKVAIVAALDTTLAPPATAESQPPQDNFTEIENFNSPDDDSLYSAGEERTSIISDREQLNLNGHSQEDLTKLESKTDDTLVASFSLMLNVTDESGRVDDVEIYDPNLRDLEKEAKISHDIEEAKRNGEKKQNELESLLDEHSSLVQEIKQMKNELHD